MKFSTSPKVRLILLSILTCSSLLANTPFTTDVINRARATIGTEKSLDGVVTLRVVGRLEAADPKVPEATLLIIARKPSSQRLEIRMDDIVETTILNGRKACIIRSNLKEKASKMRELTGPELERVLHSTRQLFSFYRPDFKNGERVSYQGITTHRDKRAHKIKYSYPEGIETIRYFSVKDDTLVASISGNGVESFEQGKQVVKGIKFPESIEYYEKGRRLHTIHLAEISVNEPLAAGIFRIPKANEK